ncbi:hypothetical protein ACFOSD_12700 [Salinispirillum marinum]|uniref:Uncharacterized protein n=2 Tax=Saccharospirillaceae TaxID=255527 RepID=A0ABV8BIS3_9GAMM
MHTVGKLRRFLSFVLAVGCTTALGSAVQTQFNLAALAAMDVDIDWAVRWSSTQHDLLYFSPIFAILVVPGFFFAFLLAGVLARLLSPLRGLIFALAGGSALWVAFWVINTVLPMPTLIAATRTSLGLYSMVLTGVVGGWVFARLTRTGRQGWDPQGDIRMRFR